MLNTDLSSRGLIMMVLVVPCYNEAERLDPRAFIGFLATHPGVRCVFVDDGSADATGERLAGLCTAHPEQVEVLTLACNQGKAEAVRAGMLHALEGPGEYLAFWDADLASQLEEVDGFLALLPGRPPALLGSRWRRLGSHIERSLARYLLGRVFATAVSRLIGLPVYDSQCGAKFFRRDLCRPIFAAPFQVRWIFDVEILLRLRRDFPDEIPALIEHPLTRWRDVGTSRLGFLDFFKAPLELLRLHRLYK